jgi:tRNA dimethylallyltransferase
MHNLVFCIMGPTASGKTDLAIELVTQFPFEIISIDSAMIYRDMDIGTAKPSARELEKAPHHLIDIINPNESYSVAQCCEDVWRLCGEIRARNKAPLLVGGTMLYFNALMRGLSTLPSANPEIRQQLLALVEEKGLAALHAQLQERDKVSAARIHPNDSVRLIRAFEVMHLTGKTLTEIYASQKNEHQETLIPLVLFPENRAWLHERIARRFHLMLEAGFVEEVQTLIHTWKLTDAHASMKSVGYRQVSAYLKGDFDFAALQEKGIAATRQVAKRQLTWLRSFEDAYRFDPESSQTHQRVVEKITEISDNAQLF